MKKKKRMYPWKQTTEQELDRDYQWLRAYPVTETYRIPSLGYRPSNHYFQYIRMSTMAPNGVIPTQWLDQNWEKYLCPRYINKDPFSRWAFMTRSCAQFNPALAVQIYRKYQATHVFDPFAGWGDRCIAAMACDIHYEACDSNPLLQEPYQQMIHRFPTKYLPIIHCPSRCEEIPVPSTTDLVFSSPPFYTLKGKLMERYDQTTSDYQAFMRDCLIPLRERTHARIILHLPVHMGQSLMDAWGPAEEIHLGRYGQMYVWESVTAATQDDRVHMACRVHPYTEPDVASPRE